jgi:hypothetical protein
LTLLVVFAIGVVLFMVIVVQLCCWLMNVIPCIPDVGLLVPVFVDVVVGYYVVLNVIVAC